MRGSHCCKQEMDITAGSAKFAVQTFTLVLGGRSHQDTRRKNTIELAANSWQQLCPDTTPMGKQALHT